MSTTKKDLLEKILEDLEKIEGLEDVVIASADGLVVAMIIPLNKKLEIFAAMSASILGAAETASADLGKGIPQRVIVETNSEKIIIIGAGPKALLSAVLVRDAALGLVLLEMSKAANKTKEILE